MKKLIGFLAILITILTLVAAGNYLTAPFVVKNVSFYLFTIDFVLVGIFIGLSIAQNKIDKCEKKLNEANRQINLFVMGER